MTEQNCDQQKEFHQNRSFRQDTYYPFDERVPLILETVYPNEGKPEIEILTMTPSSETPGFFLTHRFEDPHSPVHRKVMHKHKYCELVYVIRGNMYQKIENFRHLYPAGSLCLLNKNIHHAEEFNTYYQAAFLSLPDSLINDLLRPDSFYFRQEFPLRESSVSEFLKSSTVNTAPAHLEYMDLISITDSPNPRMYRYFDLLLDLFLNPEIGSTYRFKEILLKIFADLIDSNLYSTTSVNIGNDVDAEIFSRITDKMIKTHGRIPRSKLSDEMNYNGNYLNKIVKKYTGMNLFNYGMTICIKEACQLLTESDLSVSQISEYLGFSNRSHFYRIFEEQCGIPPAQYRKSRRLQPKHGSYSSY